MKNDGKKKAGTQVDSNLLVLDIYIYISTYLAKERVLENMVAETTSLYSSYLAVFVQQLHGPERPFGERSAVPWTVALDATYPTT